jgi:hypothetical protein
LLLGNQSLERKIRSATLGKHYFDTAPTGLHRKAILPGESGLLGNGLMVRFGVVTVNEKVGLILVLSLCLSSASFAPLPSRGARFASPFLPSRMQNP